MSDGSPKSIFSEIEHSSAYPIDLNSQEMASDDQDRTNNKTLALYEAYAMSQIALNKVELRQEFRATLKEMENDMKASLRNLDQHQQYTDLADRLAHLELSVQALEESCAKNVGAYEARLISISEKQERYYLRKEGQDTLREYVTLAAHNQDCAVLRDSMKTYSSRIEIAEERTASIISDLAILEKAMKTDHHTAQSFLKSLLNKFTSIASVVQAVEQAGSSSLTVLKRLTDQLTGIEARVETIQIQNQNAIDEARDQMCDALQLGSVQTWDRELQSNQEEQDEAEDQDEAEVEATVKSDGDDPKGIAVGSSASYRRLSVRSSPSVRVKPLYMVPLIMVALLSAILAISFGRGFRSVFQTLSEVPSESITPTIFPVVPVYREGMRRSDRMQ